MMLVDVVIVALLGYGVYVGYRRGLITVAVEPAPKQEDKPVTTDLNSEQMQSTDPVVGTGDEAVAGKTVAVKYTGTLTNGTKFDSTADHGDQPFEFVLGAGKVIKGWDQGVVGMKVGGKRHLVIPPALGYGSQAVGTIPPNATLVFDIELIAVK